MRSTEKQAQCTCDFAHATNACKTTQKPATRSMSLMLLAIEHKTTLHALLLLLCAWQRHVFTWWGVVLAVGTIMLLASSSLGLWACCAVYSLFQPASLRLSVVRRGDGDVQKFARTLSLRPSSAHEILYAVLCYGRRRRRRDGGSPTKIRHATAALSGAVRASAWSRTSSCVWGVRSRSRCRNRLLVDDDGDDGDDAVLIRYQPATTLMT